MNIRPYRSSFICYLVGNESQSSVIEKILSKEGYRPHSFSSIEEAKEKFSQEPCHQLFLLIDDPRKNSELDEFLRYIYEISEETHIHLVCPQEALASMHQVFGGRVYDILVFPLAHKSQVIRAADRAAEVDFYHYRNEELERDLSQRPTGPEAVEDKEKKVDAPVFLDPFKEYAEYQQKLFQQLSQGSSVQTFLNEIQSQLGETGGAVFFKYISPRKVLAASFSVGVDSNLIKQLGVDFAQADASFSQKNIPGVKSHSLFKGMMKDIFALDRFEVLTLEVLGEVIGVVAYWVDEPNEVKTQYIENAFSLLVRNCLAVELEKKLHTNMIFDSDTQSLNRNSFLQALGEEVARSRRTSLPVSLVVFSGDRIEELKQMGEENVELFHRTMVRIVKKHSRVNDIVGRLGEDEFGLILPHTPKHGAIVKAERIRRMIESADFSRILPSAGLVTLSLAVSEYPSNCKDAEDLYQSADDALFEFKKQNINKVCVVPPPEGFIADFFVKQPTDSLRKNS